MDTATPRAGPPHSLERLLSASARAVPDRVAVDDGETCLTYRQLVRRSRLLASELRRVLPEPATVGLCTPGCASFVALQSAIIAEGHDVLQVAPDALAPLLRAVRAGECDAIIADDQVLEIFAAEADPPALLRVQDSSLRRRGGHSRRPTRTPSLPRRGRVVLATSGTAGEPKLVTHAESSFRYAATALVRTLNLRPDDRLLHHLPLHRGAGFFLWAGLSVGATNLIALSRARELPAVLAESGCTGCFTVSVGLHELVSRTGGRSSLPSLRTIYYSSGPVTVTLKRQLVEAFGDALVQDYGMTEVPEPVTVLTRDEHLAGVRDPDMLSSVGRPVHPDRIRCRGDVWLRSPHMFEGYWHEQELTEQAVQNGWLLTRDKGHLDERGYLHLDPRTDGMARSGGIDIDARAVEAALRVFPGVAGAAVEVIDDDRFGQCLAARVMLVPGSSGDRGEIRDALRAALGPLMFPRKLDIVDHNPETTTAEDSKEPTQT